MEEAEVSEMAAQEEDRMQENIYLFIPNIIGCAAAADRWAHAPLPLPFRLLPANSAELFADPGRALCSCLVLVQECAGDAASCAED